MAKAQITTDDVRRAIVQLSKAGKAVSQRAVMSLIGGRRERIAELLAQIAEEDAPPTEVKVKHGGHVIEHPEFRRWLDANLESLARNGQPWLEQKLPYKDIPDGINLLAMASTFERGEIIQALEERIEQLEAQAVRSPRPFLRELPLPYDQSSGNAPRHLSLWLGSPWDERGGKNKEEVEDFDDFEGLTLDLARALELLRGLASTPIDTPEALRLAGVSIPQWVHAARAALAEPVRPAVGEALADLDSYFAAESYYRANKPDVAWWEGTRRGSQRQKLAHLDRHTGNAAEMGRILRTYPEFFKLIVALCKDAGVPWSVDDSALAEEMLSNHKGV